MEIINANITRMEEVEIFGIPALYTSYRVSRQTVHLGLYRYGQTQRTADPAALWTRQKRGFAAQSLPLSPWRGQGARAAP